MSLASPQLHDPARHEPLLDEPWSEEIARSAIDRIVADSLASFTPESLWAAHPLDDPNPPGARYSMLYLGAGGVILGLRSLARSGVAVPDLQRFDATVGTLVERNRTEGETALGGTASYLMGDAGLLLLQWQVSRDAAVADRLHATVAGNLDHPARESLWGSPGTLIAALHMADATGEPRWADVIVRGVERLREQMRFDAAQGVWLWDQDLYGKMSCFIGAGHGAAGNFYPVLRAAPYLPAALYDELIERARTTFQALALQADGACNWMPYLNPARPDTRPPLLQDCHGAPGIVCRLAGAPRTTAWDALLIGAGEATWRAGPLVKGPGLCHGTAGNGYAFLKLFTRTGDFRWLDRARAFATHAAVQVEAARARHGQGRHSLWTGDIGVALYLQSCIAATSDFPSLDTF